MRKDISKVVVERPRVGGGKNKSAKKNFDWDGIGEPPSNKESMRRRHVLHYQGKEFSDFLAPLKRFLEKSVGRPWDKVYSEICENLRVDSTQQRHVRQHVYQYVERNAILREDGVVCYMSPYFGLTPIRPDDLYVCPRTGLLKKAKRKK